jgi:hypothetical protein
MWRYQLDVSYCYNPSPETQTAEFPNLKATFPPGSLTTDTTVTLGIDSLPGSLLESLRSASLTYFLSLIQWLQTSPTQFAIQEESVDFPTPASITITYNPEDIPHLVESELTINRWDDTSNSWVALPTTIDTDADDATAQTSSAGSFILQAPLICPADTLEPNDDYDGASVLQTDGTLVSNLFDIAQDEDWFRLEAIAGGRYTIQTSGLSAGVDTIVQLYDQDGTTVLASDDNGGGGLASQLLWQAPLSGAYFVRVSQAAGSAYGCNASYSVSAAQHLEVYLPLIQR